MLRPTKGMGHPSPPPSLASAALWASDGGSEGMAWPDPMINFAELDAQNSLLRHAFLEGAFSPVFSDGSVSYRDGI
ncbi:hypothetical protein CWO89_43955 [Bradyrhizobium sp. Leo170]|nr:hypothetical protein CWO89_43955 [Bradyrhizobium sp. Leo170]